ncbi:MAG: polyisoprenoid-binding protein [Myxococcaceae bacterium]|nr:polyisoprenoid-binding protein [Myxococcaceae bacterium]
MSGRHLIVTAALALAVPASAFAADWEIDPVHSSAFFSVRHMMVSNVKGQFTKLTGTFHYDEKNPANSTAEATIEASSIDTHEPKRDAHLRSPDFFDVEKYPTITFKSTRVQKAGKGKLKVTGDLTMHGVTKSVVLDVEGPTAPVKSPMGDGMKSGLTATTTLHRKDFGLTWNQTLDSGGVLIGDDVKVTLEIELNQKAPAATEAAKEGATKAVVTPASGKK